MLSVLIDMEFGRHARFLQREIERDAVLRRHTRVIIRVEQERGRRVLRHLRVVRQPRQQRGVGRVAEQVPARPLMRIRLGQRDDGIAENQEIRPRIPAIDLVALDEAGVGIVEERARGGREVSARREAHDADAARVELQRRRERTHVADRALRVHQHHGVMVFRPEPVLEHEGGDANHVHPLGHLLAFVIHRQPHVAAARTHDHRRPGRRRLLRIIRRQRRHILIGRALRERRAAGPEWNRHACRRPFGLNLRLSRGRAHPKSTISRAAAAARLHRIPSCISFLLRIHPLAR